MKRIIFFICLMFFSFNVKALEPTLNYQENIYSNRVGDQNKIWSGKMAFIFMDGQIVYCLDPYLIVGNNYSVNNNYYIKPDDLEYFSIVAYYGYNSTNRNSIYYYMAAQELIWERIIGNGNVFWTTGQYNTGDRIDISGYKREIENDINNFYLKPNLNNEYHIHSLEPLSLTDSNKVLSKYQVISRGQSNIEKEGNNLSINVRSDNVTIRLERRIRNNIQTKVFQTSNGQTLAQFGTNIANAFNINIVLDYLETTVFLKFRDEDTNEEIDDVSFYLCDSDKEIVKTERGYKIEGLIDGVYYLCGFDNPYRESKPHFDIRKVRLVEEMDIILALKKREEPKREIEDSTEDKDEVVSEPIKEIKKEEINDEESLGEIELPNTYDYEMPIYILAILTLLGSVYYKIK